MVVVMFGGHCIPSLEIFTDGFSWTEFSLFSTACIYAYVWSIMACHKHMKHGALLILYYVFLFHSCWTCPRFRLHTSVHHLAVMIT